MTETPIKILLVDDDEDSFVLTRDLLSEARQKRYLLNWAADSETGLAMIQRREHDIYLLDYRLGPRSGLEILRDAVVSGCLAPMIILTGLEDHQADVEAMAAGASDYLLKGEMNSVLLERAIRYSIERQKAVAAAMKSEQYFRRLTENSLDIITILNADGTIRYESSSVQQVFGYSPAEYRGRNAFEFVHPEDLAYVVKEFTEALQNAGDTPVITFRFRHRNGSYRLLEGMGKNLLADPVVAGIIFNSRDVTDRKSLEEQYRQAQKLAVVGQLAGGVAHDFNNILTVVLGFSDLIIRQLDPSDRRYLNIVEIRKAAERGASLTRQLLAFSRKQVLQPKLLDLNAVLDDMEGMILRLLGEHIKLVISQEKGLCSVNVDPTQIEQVIMNLVVNARDAMPNGGRVVMETENVLLDHDFAHKNLGVNPGKYIRLSVSDTGIGMPLETQAHIFEPFFTTKGVGKGTGLGLATCHGIVKQSGGHITVYSEPGHGTIFKIYLPSVGQSAGPLSTATEEPGGLIGGNATILIAEDETAVREFSAATLRDCGYNVLEASDGHDALERARDNGAGPIDLLVTDVIMPNMGGQELARRFRKEWPGTKVLFCSGYTADIMGDNGVLDESVMFLQKPFSSRALAGKVREVLLGPSMD